MLQVAVVGVPNAGKSTLTNVLVGKKVSAVSARSNTTQDSHLGAFTEGATQVTLYDTPGVVTTSKYRDTSHATRVRSAWTAAADSDVLLLVLDAHRQVTRPDPRVLALVEHLAQGPLPDWDPPPALLVLNKVDLLPKDADQRLQLLATKLTKTAAFEKVYSVSATRGTGMAELRSDLLARATPGAWVMRATQHTDKTPLDLAQEVVREKFFRRVRDELPYDLKFGTSEVNLLRDGSIRIELPLLMANSRLVKMVVGARGCVIGEIGITARKELIALLKRNVHLILPVKLDKQAR
ncbi:hypothetical protein WJX81_007236 [Elliptochloris bilobata]|uniref:G domain-containing protein n=1 Tax=Elliptochloris bilobata TaxID=381761 RepID=A0AAW1RS99_9CHLO